MYMDMAGSMLLLASNPSGAVEASGSCFLSAERVRSIFGVPQVQVPKQRTEALT